MRGFRPRKTYLKETLFCETVKTKEIVLRSSHTFNMDALAAIAIFAAKTAVNVQDTALQRLFRIQAIEENTCPVSVPLDLRLFLSRTAASNRA